MTKLIDPRTTLLPLILLVGCATPHESERTTATRTDAPEYELGDRVPIGDPTAPTVPTVKIADAPKTPIQVTPNGAPVVWAPVLHYVVFDKGATLDREAEMLLDSVADHLHIDDRAVARLVSCGDANRPRAQWRVDAVHDYFRDNGIPERRVQIREGAQMMHTETDDCVEVRIVQAARG